MLNTTLLPFSNSNNAVQVVVTVTLKGPIKHMHPFNGAIAAIAAPSHAPAS
jgi:hypothetical protein